MDKITRSSFLKQSFRAGAILMVAPLPRLLFAQEGSKNTQDASLLKKLVDANDGQVDDLLKSDFDNRTFSRRIGHDFNVLTASYCSPTSRYYRSETLVIPLEKLSQHLLKAQADDGTVNVGNLESPPDTAFIIEVITAAAFPLLKEKAASLARVKTNITTFLRKAGSALVAGGVHTPNHRWVICAALARLNALFPDRKYVERIDDWLGEGIFINTDGNYPERSRIYSMVEDSAFLTMARLLNKPALFEPVRKNLETTYYYTEPDGDLVSNDSRRQDQYPWRPDANVRLSNLSYYLLYRYMAIKDRSPFFAAITKQIESHPEFTDRIVKRELIHFLEEPLLLNQLPSAAPLPLQYEKVFTHSHLLRIRRNNITSTLFGGVDWPLIIASGRSCSPDFFSYRKGTAALNYLRLSTSFFSTGYFYSEGLKKVGKSYVLSKKITAPYYQPLPKQLRKKDGDYALTESTDGRFWNKMDFRKRPVSNVKSLQITITLTEAAGRNNLLFDVEGQAGVNVTIELCFAKGGKLSGVTGGENENYFLESGTGKYEMTGDAIEFGPGIAKHKQVTNLEGERYATHFGSLRTEGMHVYLTGTTPFTHTLTFS
jgi:hypothetical protein